MKHSYVTDCDERYQFPAAFSYSITFSGQEEVVVFKILYERLHSYLLKAVGKWKFIFLCLIQTTALLLLPSHFLSPMSFTWLCWLLSIYIFSLSYLSSFFSLFLCPNSPVPICLTVISVLPIFLHMNPPIFLYMKPFDLTYIGRPTSFVCIKEEKSRQQMTGLMLSLCVFEYFALLTADDQEFPVYSCLICLITSA